MALTMSMLQDQINELRKEIASLKADKKERIIKKGLTVGDTFELIGIKWTILNIEDGKYQCLGEKLESSMVFDGNLNDWRNSSLRKYLNSEFFNKLADAVGSENIVSFNRDLLSLDGQTEYESCEDLVSLLTFDEYRKYRSMIPNTDDYWWWLITPLSTKCNNVVRSVAVVSPDGASSGTVATTTVVFAHLYLSILQSLNLRNENE